MRTVLIAGIADRWGTRLARRLSTRADLQLIGIDSRPPAEPAGKAETLILPLKGQQVAELLQRSRATVVVLPSLVGELTATGAETAKQANVLGTLELLGACLRAGVEQVIIRSSTLVYGPAIKNPAFLPERRPLAERLRTPWLRDLLEIEQVAAEFARNHPQLCLTILRFAAVVGGGVLNAQGAYFAQPAPQRATGFDPRVQVLHGDDALAAIEHAIDRPLAGPINLAADPPLPLSRALRIARPPEPSPLDGLARLVATLQSGSSQPLFDPEYLRYSCIADTTRMRGEFGFSPQQSAETALTALNNQGYPQHEVVEVELQTFLERKTHERRED